MCSVYAPVCTNWRKAIKPCAHLCNAVRKGCTANLERFGLEWPEGLDCDKMPEKPVVCFSPGQVPHNTGESATKVQSNKKCGKNFECPPYMEVQDSQQQDDYSFMGVSKCSAPCDKNKILYWSSYQQDFADWWIGIWSILCCVSTVFTVFTYLIDMSRFRYPERPIVFLSGCYLMVSIAYIIGFIEGNGVACRQSCVSGNCNNIVVQGTKEAGCTILFMLLYFFSMASSIWWVVLTVTWFLAAGLKWGNEAIEAISHYFHMVAWAVPATLTIVILAMARIEGDVLSGVCFVGVYDSQPLLWFVIIPLVTFLLAGTGFLIAGFIAMFHIRTVVKNSAEAKVGKLERLMVRIGIFSVLYTVPATVTIACYFYEYTRGASWMKAWMYKDCPDQQYENVEPDFIVFIIKYFMMLIVGITSGFWIWSSKTFESWGNFRRKICCCCSKAATPNNTKHIVTQNARMNSTNRNMYMRGHAVM